MTGDRRFPRAVYKRGSEPDPRFSLANERTFLAWIRTSLALVAAGIALEALQLPIAPALRLASAAIFTALGFLAAVYSWIGWVRTEAAMREARPLPGPSLAVVLATGVAAAVILIGIGLLV